MEVIKTCNVHQTAVTLESINWISSLVVYFFVLTIVALSLLCGILIVILGYLERMYLAIWSRLFKGTTKAS